MWTTRTHLGQGEEDEDGKRVGNDGEDRSYSFLLAVPYLDCKSSLVPTHPPHLDVSLTSFQKLWPTVTMEIKATFII